MGYEYKHEMSQVLLCGWMYKVGLSECIYCVRLIPVHP